MNTKSLDQGSILYFLIILVYLVLYLLFLSTRNLGFFEDNTRKKKQQVSLY